MSDSFKKHPITGITTAESEKDYKASSRRAYRRVTKQRLNAGQSLPDEKEYGDRWGGPKDGRQYLEGERLRK